MQKGEQMTEIEKEIGYEFKDKNLLEIALTHSSYSNEKNNKVQSYERFEFLGDSVLSIITSEKYNEYISWMV